MPEPTLEPICHGSQGLADPGHASDRPSATGRRLPPRAAQREPWAAPLGRLVFLLRGVKVGRGRKVPMAGFQAVLEEQARWPPFSRTGYRRSPAP